MAAKGNKSRRAIEINESDLGMKETKRIEGRKNREGAKTASGRAMFQ
tara:strand:+ start:136 stop:276 length:141 start_codon:yes stop_codon:yes gene_type:complete